MNKRVALLLFPLYIFSSFHVSFKFPYTPLTYVPIRHNGRWVILGFRGQPLACAVTLYAFFSSFLHFCIIYVNFFFSLVVRGIARRPVSELSQSTLNFNAMDISITICICLFVISTASLSCSPIHIVTAASWTCVLYSIVARRCIVLTNPATFSSSHPNWLNTIVYRTLSLVTCKDAIYVVFLF